MIERRSTSLIGPCVGCRPTRVVLGLRLRLLAPAGAAPHLAALGVAHAAALVGRVAADGALLRIDGLEPGEEKEGCG